MMPTTEEVILNIQKMDVGNQYVLTSRIMANIDKSAFDKTINSRAGYTFSPGPSGSTLIRKLQPPQTIYSILEIKPQHSAALIRLLRDIKTQVLQYNDAGSVDALAAVGSYLATAEKSFVDQQGELKHRKTEPRDIQSALMAIGRLAECAENPNYAQSLQTTSVKIDQSAYAPLVFGGMPTEVAIRTAIETVMSVAKQIFG